MYLRAAYDIDRITPRRRASAVGPVRAARRVLVLYIRVDRLCIFRVHPVYHKFSFWATGLVYQKVACNVT